MGGDFIVNPSRIPVRILSPLRLSNVRLLFSLTRHNLLLPHGPLNETPLAYIGVVRISVFVVHAHNQYCSYAAMALNSK